MVIFLLGFPMGCEGEFGVAWVISFAAVSSPLKRRFSTIFRHCSEQKRFFRQMANVFEHSGFAQACIFMGLTIAYPLTHVNYKVNM
jgi:hypothetical protein